MRLKIIFYPRTERLGMLGPSWRLKIERDNLVIRKYFIAEVKITSNLHSLPVNPKRLINLFRKGLFSSCFRIILNIRKFTMSEVLKTAVFLGNIASSREILYRMKHFCCGFPAVRFLIVSKLLKVLTPDVIWSYEIAIIGHFYDVSMLLIVVIIKI